MVTLASSTAVTSHSRRPASPWKESPALLTSPSECAPNTSQQRLWPPICGNALASLSGGTGAPAAGGWMGGGAAGGLAGPHAAEQLALQHVGFRLRELLGVARRHRAQRVVHRVPLRGPKRVQVDAGSSRKDDAAAARDDLEGHAGVADVDGGLAVVVRGLHEGHDGVREGPLRALALLLGACQGGSAVRVLYTRLAAPTCREEL